MKKTSKIIWGVVLIIGGIIFALNTLNITNIDVFFDGWWTLIIIIPHLVGLFTEREKIRNIIGIFVGVVLLLCCQGILSFSMIMKLSVPAVIVIIGVKLLFGGLFGGKANEMISEMQKKGKEPRTACACFSTFEMKCDGEAFDGAELTAAFGNVKCDLRNAIIGKDCAIKVSAVFGGIDILVPENVNVKVDSTSIFGVASNKTALHKDATTIYVNGVCMFGGVEIKWQRFKRL